MPHHEQGADVQRLPQQPCKLCSQINLSGSVLAVLYNVVHIRAQQAWYHPFDIAGRSPVLAAHQSNSTHTVHEGFVRRRTFSNSSTPASSQAGPEQRRPRMLPGPAERSHLSLHGEVLALLPAEPQDLHQLNVRQFADSSTGLAGLWWDSVTLACHAMSNFPVAAHQRSAANYVQNVMAVTCVMFCQKIEKLSKGPYSQADFYIVSTLCYGVRIIARTCYIFGKSLCILTHMLLQLVHGLDVDGNLKRRCSGLLLYYMGVSAHNQTEKFKVC